MNLAQIVLNLKGLKDNPYEFIIDRLIVFIASLLLPIPLSGEIISRLKRPLLGILISIFVFVLFMVTIIGTVFLTPIFTGSGILNSIVSAFQNSSDISLDSNFGDTSIPQKSPFGGLGMSYTTVTAYFLDPGYYLQFGRSHTGIDLVPSQEYYKSSHTYSETGHIVVFATISGKVNQHIDQYGGRTVEIINSDNTVKVLYIHFSSILVDTGLTIKSGTPIGIMGNTGFSTGDHVHYEVYVKSGNGWQAVNPLNYIH